MILCEVDLMLSFNKNHYHSETRRKQEVVKMERNRQFEILANA